MAKVREIMENELPDLLELYKELNPEHSSLTVEKTVSVWESILANNFIKYFGVEADGKLVSTCNITIIPNLTRGARSFAIIENVVTSEKHRGKGYGALVINKAIDCAKENNCYKVMLLSSAHRKEAHKFYEKLGFNSKDKVGFFMYI
jgi:GNAT superfamily N-acetyltransferase